MTKRRLVIDASTVARWSGPAAGIARVEREYILWSRHNVPSATTAFFDPDSQSYRPFDATCELPIIRGEIAVDHRGLSTPTRTRRRFIERVPAGIRPSLMWVLQFRRELLLALERRRLATRSAAFAERIAGIQRYLMTDRYREIMIDASGKQRPFLTVKSLLGPPLHLGPEDVLVSVGIGWTHTNIETIRRQKAERGFRFVLLLHDIIPLLFPYFYKPADVNIFRSYLDTALPLADLVVFTSKCAEADTQRYSAERGLAIGRTAIVPLGADGVRQPAPATNLAGHGVESGRYILFVSTIEPRKGHRMILDAWTQLLADGVPQRHGMKLLLVGRPGWLVDDLIADLARLEPETDRVIARHGIEDDALALFYANAAFCVFPSLYEGYGLPVVEAMQYGKPIIASSAGPVPELVGGLCPCLDPRDTGAWRDQIRAWIEDPYAVATVADRLKTYRPMTWNQSASRFFAVIDAEVP
jgi:glycosyltransferase involved in cell wall biosynthesis